MTSEIKVKLEHFFPLFGDSLFCDLTSESLKALTGIKQTKRFRKDTNLFAAGEMPCCVYLLVKGKVQIVLKGKSNNLRAVHSIQQNEIFGLTEAIANLPYETYAKTVTPCRCECIEREDFIRFLQAEPEICFRLLQMLGLNLQKSYRLFCSSII